MYKRLTALSLDYIGEPVVSEASRKIWNEKGFRDTVSEDSKQYSNKIKGFTEGGGAEMEGILW